MIAFPFLVLIPAAVVAGLYAIGKTISVLLHGFDHLLEDEEYL